ncbi:hypothetical protein AB0K49_37150, partial [Streptomyces decoyicus]
ITGTNLTGASVDFGGNPATGVTVNATGTQITDMTPRSPAPPRRQRSCRRPATTPESSNPDARPPPGRPAGA